MKKPLLIRITTVPISLKYLLKGQLRYMSANGYEVIAISADGEEVEDVKKNEGVDHIVVPFTRSITPVRDFICMLNLIRLFRKLKPAIVHTHTPKAGLLGSWAAGITGVPVRLHTVAGLPWMESTGLKRNLLQWMEKLTYRYAQKVYPNSGKLKEFIIQNKLTDPSKVKVIANGSSNGIDLGYFNPAEALKDQTRNIRQELRIGENDFVFLYIGRIVKDKGINELVSAFNELKNERKPHLILVGPFEDHLDPVSKKTRDIIEDDPCIHHVGFKEDIRPWLLASDVLAFPTYREGFPNVPMQAGAMGLPCIVTDINGCNEIIEDEKNGLLIPPKDVKALEDAMFRLMNDRELYQKLASNARSLIASRFDQKIVWEEFLEEYGNLLNHGGHKGIHKVHKE